MGNPFRQPPRLMSSQQHFSRVPDTNIQRSVFDRRSSYKTTFNAGYLVPVFIDEVLPGDSWKMRTSCFARLTTPVVPIMDNIYLDIHYFFVPNRLVWNHWEDFCGAVDPGGAPTEYTVPVFDDTSLAAAIGLGTSFDYAGIFEVPNTDNIISLPFRAINLIWNTWYRDQNMQTTLETVDLDDGPDDAGDYAALLKRGKRHDYFTSCLPEPQKGADVTLPLGSYAPVAPVYFENVGDTPSFVNTGERFLWQLMDPGVPANITDGYIESKSASSPTDIQFVRTAGAASAGSYALGFPALADHGDVADRGYLAASLADATAATINSVREAFALQQLLELDMRGGTRYVEILKNHFQVVSPDFRLQRPELLGTGTVMVNITPIPQTSGTVDDANYPTPQGNLSAMGTASAMGIGFEKFFQEHGYVIGFISARADLTYQQGIHRMWTRSTRYDYYWPSLAHLGEQAVLTQEIYCDGSSTDDEVFGYQERYAEYRYRPSMLTGLMRSGVTGSLDVWHLAQEFEAAPALDSSFISEDPPIARVQAVENEPHFLFDCVFNLECARPMPVYSVPGLGRL